MYWVSWQTDMLAPDRPVAKRQVQSTTKTQRIATHSHIKGLGLAEDRLTSAIDFCLNGHLGRLGGLLEVGSLLRFRLLVPRFEGTLTRLDT